MGPVLRGRTLDIITGTRSDIFTISRRVVRHYIAKCALFAAGTGRHFNTKEGYPISKGKAFFNFYIS